MLYKRLLILSSFALTMSCENPKENQSLKLWYDEPADEWTEALPVGNGRIGGMIFGGTDMEHIQFNEETLWTGEPRDYSREGASAYLDEIRQLLREGKQGQAERLAGMEFMGRRSNEENYPEQKEAWLNKVRSEENLKYAEPDFDDSAWKTLQVPSGNGWEELGYDAVDGALWFRFSFDLPEEWQGKDLVLELGRIRETDFTYFNGDLAGTETNRKVERVYEVPSSRVTSGKNIIAVQVLNYQDKGGFVGLDDFDKPMMVYPKGTDRADGIRLDKPWKFYMQDIDPPVFPEYEEFYQPFGDLWFTFHEGMPMAKGHENATGYRRDLDISRAVATTSYQVDGVKYTREYFVSAPDQVMVVRFTASEPGALSLSARLTSPHRDYKVAAVDEQTIKLRADVHNGALHGISFLKAVSKSGEVTVANDQIQISDADEVVFYMTAATNYKSYDDVSGKPEQLAMEDMEDLDNKSFEEIKSVHISDYQRFFDDFAIDLGKGENEGLPTDERISKFSTSNDPSLLALYVQYGRYLLTSTSRPETRPPNLQGIWNDDLTPPWGSKYTTNINLEMNYWPAEPLNLSSLNEPLFQLIEEVAEQGQETAMDHYGADGWVLHHNTDLWRATGPVNHANHGIWVTGGAWLCHHLWDHFEYTLDTAFLKERAYPLMKGASAFFVDFLVKDPETGYLISTPSNSPENGGLVQGPTMDHQIIRDLFSNTVTSAEILGVDKSFRDTLAQMLPEIAPNMIGQYGQLQEWLTDIDDPENKHRHVSHLWGVYPDDQINVGTPELLDAAKQSLIFRGDEGTGWSLAWKINLWARFRDGNHAWELIKVLLSPAWVERSGRGGSYANLFDAHPPFQIDGNFGAAAGIAELIVQSTLDEIVLLPALPDALPNGSIKGLRVKGGFELDIAWEKGALKSLKVTSKAGLPCKLKYGGQEVAFETVKGEEYQFDGNLERR